MEAALVSETHCVTFPLVKTASTVATFLRFAATRARKALPFVAMGFLLVRIADHVHDGHFSEAAIEAVRRFAAVAHHVAVTSADRRMPPALARAAAGWAQPAAGLAVPDRAERTA